VGIFATSSHSQRLRETNTNNAICSPYLFFIKNPSHSCISTLILVTQLFASNHMLLLTQVENDAPTQR